MRPHQQQQQQLYVVISTRSRLQWCSSSKQQQAGSLRVFRSTASGPQPPRLLLPAAGSTRYNNWSNSVSWLCLFAVLSAGVHLWCVACVAAACSRAAAAAPGAPSPSLAYAHHSSSTQQQLCCSSRQHPVRLMDATPRWCVERTCWCLPLECCPCCYSCLLHLHLVPEQHHTQQHVSSGASSSSGALGAGSSRPGEHAAADASSGVAGHLPAVACP